MGLTVVTGRTDAEAQERFREYASYASPEAGLRISRRAPASTFLK
jgi:alkanesulfonate monooxygenase SsuD/methylene tetrahydromethanopterin reductase-like flavin-dependent oxidoreductase (luciferase family)